MASDSNIDRAIRQLPPPSSPSSVSSPVTSPPRPPRRGSSRDVLPSHHRPGQLHVHGRTRSISISSRASGFSQEELVRPTLTFADDRGGAHDTIPGYLARAHRKLTSTPYCLVIVLLCMPRQIHSWHSPHPQESHRTDPYGRGSRTSTITRLRSLCP
jgi:hypothetical protein